MTTTAPAPATHRAHRAFPGTEASVGTARRWAADRLCHRTPRLPADVISDAVVILSELATNAVLHTPSGRPGGTYTVTLTADAVALRIVVMNQNTPTIPVARTPAPDDEAGRGLAIVAAYADSSGPVRTATGTGYEALITIGEPA